MATASRTLDAPTGMAGTSSDELAALELERGRLSLKPFSLLAVILFWQALALLNGVVAAKRRLFQTIVDPLVGALQPIPPLDLLPIIILWFGVGETSKVFFIAYSGFLVIFTTTVLGVRDVDPVLVRAAQSLGLSRLRVYRHVIFPSALPDVLVGLRLGLSVGFFVIVAAEFIAADTGLGYLINYSRTWFQVDNMMLGAVVIGALGITSNYLLVALERHLFRWRVTSR